MQIIHFTGNMGRDPENRDTNSGPVCNFSVAVRQGFDRDAKSEWFRCTVFGKRAETIGRYLRKGMKVTVAGHLKIGEYQGKPQYDVSVIDVEWPHDANQSNDRQGEQRATGGGDGFGNNRVADDLDDDVPFATNDVRADLRFG